MAIVKQLVHMISEDLIRYFADSDIKLVGWNPKSRELVLSIEKEIGPETGIIRFTSVTYLALTPALTAVSIRVANLDEAWQLLPVPEMAADGIVFVVEDIEGVKHVVAPSR